MIEVGQLRQWQANCTPARSGSLFLVTGRRSSEKAAPSTRSWFVLHEGESRWFYESEILKRTQVVSDG